MDNEIYFVNYKKFTPQYFTDTWLVMSCNIIHYPLSIIHYPLSIIHYPLSIVHYSLFILEFNIQIRVQHRTQLAELRTIVTQDVVTTAKA
jgi:hypothetical protein